MRTKSKFKKIALLTAIILALAISMTYGAIELYAYGSKDDVASSEFSEHWMAYLDDDVPLRSAVIPGAHDATTYNMAYMAKTQSASVAELLKMGVRYLDVRTTFDLDGDIAVTHGPIVGDKLAVVLNEVKEFIDSHPTEVVLLDVSQVANGAFDATRYEIFRTLLEDDPDRVVHNPYSKDADNFYAETANDAMFAEFATIGELRGKVMVFLGSNSDYNLQKDWLFKRDNDHSGRIIPSLHSAYYSNLHKSVDVLVDVALPSYLERYSEDIYNLGLNVLQCQLTDPVAVIGPRFYERVAEDRIDEFIRGLYHDIASLDVVNIIQRDFLTPQKVADIIRINIAKNNIKPSMLEQFYSLTNS